MTSRTIFSGSTRALSRLGQLSSILGAAPSTRSPLSTSSSNITLYSWPTPNGIKASITLEELGLPYKVEPIDIGTNIQKEEWFLKINPNGRIPAIKDGEQRVFESGAIMLYLVDKYDKEKKISYAPGTPDYVEMLSWLMFQMGGVGPMQGQANHFRVFAGVRSDYGIKRYTEETKRLYSVLESRLKESAYLAGSKYTIADIANYSWVRSGPTVLEFELSEWPSLKKWKEEIDQRDAVKRGADVPKREVPPEQFEQFLTDARARIDSMENTDKH